MCLFRKPAVIVFQGRSDVTGNVKDKVTGKSRPAEQRDLDIVWKYPYPVTKKVVIYPSFSHNVLTIEDGITKLYTDGKYTLDGKNKKIEIYFVTKNTEVNFLWGTPDRIYRKDPILDVVIDFGAHGSAKIVIEDTKTFLYKIVGARNRFTVDDVKKFFLAKITSNIGDLLDKTFHANELSFVEFGMVQFDVAEIVKKYISEEFKEYGVVLREFSIGKIDIPDDEVRQYNVLLKEKRLLKHQETNFRELRMAENENRKESHKEEMDRISALKEFAAAVTPDSVVTKVSKTINVTRNSDICICKKCGEKLSESSLYCPRCGHKR